MPLVSTPARLKLLLACDQCHSSRALTPLTGWHRKLCSNTEGTIREPIDRMLSEFNFVATEEQCTDAFLADWIEKKIDRIRFKGRHRARYASWIPRTAYGFCLDGSKGGTVLVMHHGFLALRMDSA
jgi:hypothetical protein